MPAMNWTVPLGESRSLGIVEEQNAQLLGKDILFDRNYRVGASGDYVLLEGAAALRQAIYRRLMTRPGEFRARPEYGVGIMDYVKKRNTLSTYDEMRQRIVDQLSLDPRIDQVTDVVTQRLEDGISITLTIKIAGRTLRFTPFDFREGGTPTVINGRSAYTILGG